jgi:hypothetical protein
MCPSGFIKVERAGSPSAKIWLNAEFVEGENKKATFFSVRTAVPPLV